MNTLIIRGYLRIRSICNTLRGAPPPPRQMPIDLVSAYTMNGQIATLHWYLNDVCSTPLKWTTSHRGWNPRRVQAGGTMYYGQTDHFLYQALQKHSLVSKEALVVGSESPWYECILHQHGARVSTIEYRKIECNIPGLEVQTPEQFAKQPRKFDVVVSISSIEHDGLGRYGDPLDPDGDLKAMHNFRDLLKPDGLLLLAVPLGPDALVWNAHRIYGPLRFPKLIEGWQLIDSFGGQNFRQPLGRWDYQPVLVLKPSP